MRHRGGDLQLGAEVVGAGGPVEVAVEVRRGEWLTEVGWSKFTITMETRWFSAVCL